MGLEAVCCGFFFFCSLLQAQLEIVKEALGMLDRRVKRVSCIVHVSFANYAYFQVGGQQGREGGAARSSKSLLWGCYLSACAIT